MEVFNKKAQGDLGIITIILSIFLLTAILIEPVNQSFDVQADTLDTDRVTDNVRDNAEELDTVTDFILSFKVLGNILKLAFFDFGNTLNLPFWLDAVFTLLFIVFVVFVIRLIRGVG